MKSLSLLFLPAFAEECSYCRFTVDASRTPNRSNQFQSEPLEGPRCRSRGNGSAERVAILCAEKEAPPKRGLRLTQFVMAPT